MDLSLATIVLWAVPVVFAITLHEAAHGYVARQFGDQTAYMLGRVTLNPLKHIDTIGTIAVRGIWIAMSVLSKAPVIILLVTGILGDLMAPLLRLGTYAVISITGL